MEPQNPHADDGPRELPPRNGQAQLFVLRTLWIALMFSEFLYVVVSYMVASQQEPASSAVEMGMLEPMLALIALGSLGASVLLPRKLLAQAMGSEDPEAISIDVLLSRSFGPWITRMAMTESVAVLGVAMALISKQPHKVIPFVVISTLALVTAYPSERSLRLFVRGSRK